MNGNRSKYTYTPTYGMQKRGLMKKSSSVRQVPEAPDFTQVPDPVIGTPLQQTLAQQPSPSSAQVQAMNQPIATPSYFTPVQPSNPPQSAMQMPFAAPNFMQPGQYAQMPPMQTPPIHHQQLPLGNMPQPQSQPTSFSARMQGFVPPQNHVSTAGQIPQMPPPQIGWNNPQPPQQPIPPFSGASTGGMQQKPGFQVPSQHGQGYPPLQPIPQQSGFTIQSTAPTQTPRSASLDADKLWSIFLFGIIPLLFIPCLFVSSAWDALRYVFLGAAVVGLGAMWYRQQYTPTSRFMISLVYVALAIATIAMLMQGVNDAKQASANVAQGHQQTAATPSPSPDSSAMAALMATPTPAPTVSGPSEAEKRLSLFMELWKVNNTTEMVNLVQPSWRSQQENASTSLFIALANRTPEDFTIEEISGTETDNSRTITMRATINKNTGKAPVVYRFMVMMVKEGGEWYINPNSLATNDAQETTTTDENVVNSQDTGTVTEPPRETVTPAPPASTSLYYNLGGNFYHMDPQCPSVAQDYLPFDSSFLYSELENYNRDLLPCLNCNAPIDPLD